MQFKEDSNTEKKIAAKLKSCLERSIFLESEDKLRRSLFDLIQASIWNDLFLHTSLRRDIIISLNTIAECRPP